MEGRGRERRAMKGPFTLCHAPGEIFPTASMICELQLQPGRWTWLRGFRAEEGDKGDS